MVSTSYLVINSVLSAKVEGIVLVILTLLSIYDSVNVTVLTPLLVTSIVSYSVAYILVVRS